MIRRTTKLHTGATRYEFRPFTVAEANRLGFSIWADSKVQERAELLARAAHETERIRRAELASSQAPAPKPLGYIDSLLSRFMWPIGCALVSLECYCLWRMF